MPEQLDAIRTEDVHAATAPDAEVTAVAATEAADDDSGEQAAAAAEEAPAAEEMAAAADEPAPEVEEAPAAPAADVTATAEEAPAAEEMAAADQAPAVEAPAAEEAAAAAAEAAAAEEAPAAEAPAAAEEAPAVEAPAAAEEAPAVETAAAADSGGEAQAAAAEQLGEAQASADTAPATATGGEQTPAGADAAADGEAPAVDPGDPLAPLYEAQVSKRPVKGKVIGWNKGGYHVAIGSVAAFCPVSQIEIGNPRGPKRYLDRSFEFQVLEIEKGGRRVVLSRAAALKAARDQRAELVRETIKAGAELEGKVSSLTDFGAFVNLGKGIEGLVHVSEISRQRVEHPKEALKSGQKVKVYVLKVEKGGERISLSMKRLEADPWKSVAERFTPGSTFTGTIRRQTDFGLFVEVAPGLEGLVHTSRLPFGVTLEHESLAVGNQVEGWVQEADPKRRRLALSLREVSSRQSWKDVDDRFPVGTVVKGQVERVASFGAFIQLEPGLTGLLPFSELKQGGAGMNLKRQYHAGKEVSVRVLSIDTGRKRISLGTESSKAEGTRADYKSYVSKQHGDGMGAMAAAFAKLKQQ